MRVSLAYVGMANSGLENGIRRGFDVKSTSRSHTFCKSVFSTLYYYLCLKYSGMCISTHCLRLGGFCNRLSWAC